MAGDGVARVRIRDYRRERAVRYRVRPSAPPPSAPPPSAPRPYVPRPAAAVDAVVREAEIRSRILTLNCASAALIRYTHERGMRRVSLERIWGAALVSAVLAGLVE